MRGELCHFDHGNDALVVEDVNIPGIVLGFPHAVHSTGFIPERSPLNPAGTSNVQSTNKYNKPYKIFINDKPKANRLWIAKNHKKSKRRKT